MDEKTIEKKEQEEPVVEKKPYTPPTLTVYGKLIQLTGGGPSGLKENQGQGGSSDKTRHP